MVINVSIEQKVALKKAACAVSCVHCASNQWNVRNVEAEQLMLVTKSSSYDPICYDLLLDIETCNTFQSLELLAVFIFNNCISLPTMWKSVKQQLYLKEEECRSASPGASSEPHQCPMESWLQPGPSPSLMGRRSLMLHQHLRKNNNKKRKKTCLHQKVNISSMNGNRQKFYTIHLHK